MWRRCLPFIVVLFACSDPPKGVCVTEKTCSGNMIKDVCGLNSGSWHEYITADEKSANPNMGTVGRETCRSLGFTYNSGGHIFQKPQP